MNIFNYDKSLENDANKAKDFKEKLDKILDSNNNDKNNNHLRYTFV